MNEKRKMKLNYTILGNYRFNIFYIFLKVINMQNHRPNQQQILHMER